MPDINVETILFMSIVKSLSVGNGDMFYIQHNSDNFTVIDCFLSGWVEINLVMFLSVDFEIISSIIVFLFSSDKKQSKP